MWYLGATVSKSTLTQLMLTHAPVEQFVCSGNVDVPVLVL